MVIVIRNNKASLLFIHLIIFSIVLKRVSPVYLPSPTVIGLTLVVLLISHLQTARLVMRWRVNERLSSI